MQKAGFHAPKSGHIFNRAIVLEARVYVCSAVLVKAFIVTFERCSKSSATFNHCTMSYLCSLVPRPSA